MNWGTKIAVVYSLFVVLMVGMVILAFQYDVNLVATDYYAQELEYQSQIDSHNNLVSLEEKMQVKVLPSTSSLEIHFPEGALAAGAQGHLQFFRPSDRAMDFDLKFDGSKGKLLQIATAKMAGGYWRIKMNWESEGKSYFYEQQIQL
jgi:hypothetical protein